MQIETPGAAAAAEDMAAINGVDCLFIGPSDLAAACGHLGNPSHPEVQAHIKHVFDIAKKAGKSAGILAPVEAGARRYMELGANFVAVGSDLGLLRNASETLKAKFL